MSRESAFDNVSRGLNEYETLVRLNSRPAAANFGVHLRQARDVQWISVSPDGDDSEIYDVSNDDLKRFCIEVLRELGVTELPKKVPTAVLTFTVEYQGGSADDVTTAAEENSYLGHELRLAIEREMNAGIWSRWRVSRGESSIEDRDQIDSW